MKILVIGESCQDIFEYGHSYRLCPDAPVPVFNPIKKIVNGGMAKNVYKNILSLKKDAFLHTNKNWKTITKTRYIDFKTNHMFIRIDTNDNKYGKAKLENINFDLYDGIIISDYNKGFLSEDDIEYISKKHLVTFLDTKKPLGPWCEDISFIKINNFEYERTRNTITNKILNNLVITIGPDGCIYRDIIYPVAKVEIKDSSGAGDTFIAALAIKYIETKSSEKAVVFANECATKVVQRRGVSTV